MQKVRLAEDGWNCCDPEKVALAYRVDSQWRNRSEFLSGSRNRVCPKLEADLYLWINRNTAVRQIRAGEDRGIILVRKTSWRGKAFVTPSDHVGAADREEMA
jgi:hypothetical protein